MKIIWWTGLIIGVTVLQTSVSPLWAVGHVTPDLLLLTVIIGAVYGRSEGIFYAAPFLGYIKDLYSGGITGVSMLIFFLTVYFIRKERHRLDFDSYLFDIIVLATTLAEGLIMFLMQQLVLAQPLHWGIVIAEIGGRALFNLFLAEVLRVVWKHFLEEHLFSMRAGKRFGKLV